MIIYCDAVAIFGLFVSFYWMLMYYRIKNKREAKK